MAHHTHAPGGSADHEARAARVLLDAEHFDCYRLALEFLELVPSLLPKRGLADLRDQLERASASIVLNTAEGLGRFSPPDKARFFTIARGSAMECASIVDVLRIRRLSADALCDRARLLLVRLIQMLSKLILHRLR
jgi:four helix bundle protein